MGEVNIPDVVAGVDVVGRPRCENGDGVGTACAMQLHTKGLYYSRKNRRDETKEANRLQLASGLNTD
jgi:hypothetical protein